MINEAPAIWIGEPGDWVPTLNFRFKEIEVEETQFASRTMKFLQQAWYDRRTEEIEWRNVPVVEE